MSSRDIDKEIGDLDELQRQLKVCRKKNLHIVGPVYESWSPSHEVDARTKRSRELKHIPILTLLREIISLVDNYEVLTVRQIYYVLLSKQLINNNRAEYKRTARILKGARLAGLILFDKIVDDTREAEKTSSWDSIEQILGAAINQYRSDWWIPQPQYVEVWLEKRALRRIFYPITNSYDVHLCVGGGYQSWSEIWEAKKRFESREGQEIVILYFGDLDPSGKDMPRDIRERFQTLKIPVTVEEIALTEQDIQKHNLPRNPTKGTDTRNSSYIGKYGIDYAVELDALPPDVLREKIDTAILDHVDLNELLSQREDDENQRREWKKQISGIARRKVESFLAEPQNQLQGKEVDLQAFTMMLSMKFHMNGDSISEYLEDLETAKRIKVSNGKIKWLKREQHK